MIKNSVHALLLSTGLLIGTSHVMAETNAIEIKIIQGQGDEKTAKAAPATLSSEVIKISIDLAKMITVKMSESIDQSGDQSSDFSYTRFAQVQAEGIEAMSNQVSKYVTTYNLEQSEIEQVQLFALFLMQAIQTFLQNNTSFTLELMAATTKKSAREITARFNEYVLGLPAAFDSDFAAGKIQKPAEVKFLNNADVDYSTQAFRSRVADSLSEVIDLIEDIAYDAINDCTDSDEKFDGKRYMQKQGSVIQKVSEQIQVWFDKKVTLGIAQGDAHHITVFLAQYLPQVVMKFRSENPNFETQLVEATTKDAALDLIDPQFAAYNAAKENYLNENFPICNDELAAEESDDDFGAEIIEIAATA